MNKIVLTIIIAGLIILIPTAINQSKNRQTSNAVLSSNIFSKPEPQISHQQHSYLDYSHNSERKESTGILGNKITRYYVYVKNKDYVGGYFTVKFHFTDYYGKTSTELITKYIKPQEQEKFFYQTIKEDKYNLYKWDYEVISQTKQPIKSQS